MLRENVIDETDYLEQNVWFGYAFSMLVGGLGENIGSSAVAVTEVGRVFVSLPSKLPFLLEIVRRFLRALHQSTRFFFQLRQIQTV